MRSHQPCLKSESFFTQERQHVKGVIDDLLVAIAFSVGSECNLENADKRQSRMIPSNYRQGVISDQLASILLNQIMRSGSLDNLGSSSDASSSI